jgi:hypothetical protein
MCAYDEWSCLIDQFKEKEKKQKRILEVEKLIFLLVIFSLLLFPLHFKDDFYRLR